MQPALSGSLDTNKPLRAKDITSRNFTMRQAADASLPDPDWGVEVSQFITDDLKNYPNAHLQSLLIDVKEIIPDELYNQIFIAGGFASYLAGVTNAHTDIDLFCITADAFNLLHNLIITDTKNFIIRALPIEDIRPFYHKVLKFTYQNIDYDLVDSSKWLSHKNVFARGKNVSSPTQARLDLCSLLSTFDLNWAMVGISLSDDIIVCHPSAFLTKPFINTTLSYRVNATNAPRVEKYASRLVRKVDVKATQIVVTALGFMPTQPDFGIS